MVDSSNTTSVISNTLQLLEWASTSVANLNDNQLNELCRIKDSNSTVPPFIDLVNDNPSNFLHSKPSALIVWSVGLSFVTLINMCAVVGIGVMRYLSKNVYNQVITFCVGLGVGSLSGSSLYHLLPQAHPILLDHKNEDGTPSHEYLNMAHFSLIGVYTFFLADKLIKVILQGRKKNLRESIEWKENGISSEISGRSESALLHNHIHHKGSGDGEIEMNAIDSSTKSIRNQKGTLASIASNVSVSSVFFTLSIPPPIMDSDDDSVHGICSHEHELEFEAGDSAIAAVAWMIVFGDGLHNLIDGISIGASFAESLHSGLSISMAVLAEEFPHELGDVAILVASGLSLRQALLYNLLSALTCYVGFAFGVIIGELGPDTTKYLFALAGGMFLYISLSCMMPEMKKAMEEALAISLPKGIYVFLLQACGLLCGLSLMYLMARYGEEISF